MKLFSISTKKVGLSPGALVFTGRRQVEHARVSSMVFSGDDVQETTHDVVDDVRPQREGTAAVQWVNVEGLHDVDLLRALGQRFGLHPLALEDIASVGARPHITTYEDSVFVSLKMLTWTEEEMATAEHVSLALGRNWVLSFQERPGDVLEGVRERIRSGTARVTTLGADYLWYALLDAIVDHYIPVMERIVGLAEGVEEQIWSSGGEARDTGLVLRLRGEALEVTRALRPLREAIDGLIDDMPDLIRPETRPFFADLREHVGHLGDVLDGVRDTLAAVMDAHIAVVSMRTNEVMKVLTIMASIFIPITFLAGVYGMNFQHMPELASRWGYPTVWAVMIGSVIGMLMFFRRKGWL